VSGVPEIDAIIAAVESGDEAALAPLVSLMETRCTNAPSLGGPPKCSSLPGSPPEGSAVRAIPIVLAEGSWGFEPVEVARLVLNRQPRLYGAARLEPSQPLFRNEPGFPTLDHLILFEFAQPSHPRLAIGLGVWQGQIVAVLGLDSGPPESLLDNYEPYEIILRGPANQ
jgi:hypothetical protein